VSAIQNRKRALTIVPAMPVALIEARKGSAQYQRADRACIVGSGSPDVHV
jgi:hypothetical protein